MSGLNVNDLLSVIGHLEEEKIELKRVRKRIREAEKAKHDAIVQFALAGMLPDDIGLLREAYKILGGSGYYVYDDVDPNRDSFNYWPGDGGLIDPETSQRYPLDEVRQGRAPDDDPVATLAALKFAVAKHADRQRPYYAQVARYMALHGAKKKK